MESASLLSPALPPPASRALGSTIAGKYVLLEPIGTGSMGTVYRARHTALERDVALKLMAPEVANDRSFAARFRREAHAASRLTHPNSVMTIDFGEEPDGLLYLVMEYVRGESLEAMLERGRELGERRIVDILSQVLSAVAMAHAAGIVHRDLKPANIMVVETLDDDGNPVDVVKVCDFGVAALRDHAELVTTARYAAIRPDAPAGNGITMAGAVVGTPAYMAPEQASGGVQDARTDLYSLGIVLFEMLTGRLPLWGDTLEDTMRAQITRPAPSPREFVECTPELANVCLQALAKLPSERFESARAMRAALRAALEPAELAAPSSVESVRPEATGSLAGVAAVHEIEAEAIPARRSRLGWLPLVAAVAVGAVASVSWLTHGRPYETAAHRLVARAGTLVEQARQPDGAQPAPPTPDRAPLAMTSVAKETAALVEAEAVAPERLPVNAPARKARGREQVRTPPPSAAPPAQEDASAEVAVATEAPTAEPVPAVAAEVPAPAAVEAAPAVTDESARVEPDKAWGTRH